MGQFYQENEIAQIYAVAFIEFCDTKSLANLALCATIKVVAGSWSVNCDGQRTIILPFVFVISSK